MGAIVVHRFWSTNVAKLSFAHRHRNVQMIRSLGGLVGLIGDKYHAVSSLVLAMLMSYSLYP